MSDAPKPRKKKISRTEVSKLSPAELWVLTKDVYGKLYAYMKPFRRRFYTGIILSIVSGLFSIVMLAGIQVVFTVVLAGNPNTKKATGTPWEVLKASFQQSSAAAASPNPEPTAATTPVATASPTTTAQAPASAAPAANSPAPASPAASAPTSSAPAAVAATPPAAAPAAPVSPPAPSLSKADADEEKEVKAPSIKLPGIMGGIDLKKLLNIDTSQKLTLSNVIVLCSLVPLLMLLRGLLSYAAKYSMLWVGNRVLYNLRNDVFRSVLGQSLGYFNKAKVGDLIQTVFNQTRVAQTNAVQLSQLIIEKPVAIIATLAFIIYEDWIFALCSIVIFPLCIAPILHVSRRVRKAGAREEEEAGAIMVTMHESFAGIRVVKSHAREDYELKRFDKANSAMLDSIMRWSKALELVGPLVETVASIGICLALIYAYQVNMGASRFLTIVTGLMSMYPHAKELSRVQLVIQKCIVATSSVFAVMDQKPDIEDAPDAKKLKRSNGQVSFKDVAFHYSDPNGKRLAKAAVQGVSLTLERGKFYALVGPSGAGKSTLFSLLLRFYDPSKGSVELDGIDIRSLSQQSLRNNIGVVNQDTFLFHDTIGENIRYGRLDATDEEIEQAAKRAHLHDFIMTLKDGYDTVVGDAGSNLSGGQKQRVSIARAILRDAPILLLDEATSALDTETEKVIQEAIHDLSTGRTVIAIAHRLSTVLEAHQIVVMKDGKVDAVGSHQELLGKSDLYQRLYSMQFQDSAAETE